MSKVQLFVTLDPVCARDSQILNRLHCSGFRQSVQKPNLFYRVLTKEALKTAAIDVSYYYYDTVVGSTKPKYIKHSNRGFDLLVINLVSKDETKRMQNEFNKSNGYV